VTFGLVVLPLIAWRIVMTVVYARTQSGVVAQLMHFAYTGSLGAFIPLAAVSPTQDALVYAIVAGALWLGVAGLAVGGATSRAQAPPAPLGRVDGA
jgi:VIT1/CCC1 family predicted Fe2+/Mn2+ transporter